MTWFRILFTAVCMLALITIPTGSGTAQDDATIELHWRDCATIPAEETSWYDHCHDGPLRESEHGNRPATFIQNETGEAYTGELDGNGDMTISVPAGTYTFQHPPFHDAEAHAWLCSSTNEAGEPDQPVEDPMNILLQSGDHVICDFFVVWGGGRAAIEPVQPGDPQGIIEIRWRACEEASVSDDEWFDDCFEATGNRGTEPQEGRRMTVRNADDNTPRSDFLDEHGNVQIPVPLGNYTVPTMTGDFVTADFLYCSEVNEAGTATTTGISTEPLSVEDGMHVICDYYYVAE